MRPAAEALNAVVNWDTAVEFTLTGEQGLSVFSHPRSWSALLDRTKAVTSRCGVCVVCVVCVFCVLFVLCFCVFVCGREGASAPGLRAAGTL